MDGGFGETFENKAQWMIFWMRTSPPKAPPLATLLVSTTILWFQDLHQSVIEVAEYLGKSLTEKQAERLVDHLDFSSMKKNVSVNLEQELRHLQVVPNSEDVNFIRKGLSGQWKEAMSPELIEKFNAWSQKHLCDTDFPYYEWIIFKMKVKLI